MKCRIIKRLDGSVIYSWPSSKNRDVFDSIRLPEELGFNGLESIILDDSEIPISNSQTGNYHEMIYFDGPCTKENLKQDKNWEVMLMPVFLIKQTYEKRLNEKIDLELNKEDSDLKQIFKWQQELKSLSEYSDLKWYQQALINLEDSVRLGNPDKPLIKQKLNAKISSLL